MLGRVACALAALAAAVPGPAGAGVIRGGSGQGSSYAFHLPDAPVAWNGDLVVYLHGIVAPALEVAVQESEETFVPLRDGLVPRGWALAAASYSMNGWNVADAARRTVQVLGLFQSKVGRPRRVFLVGQSMGSLVGLYLLEGLPRAFHGALLGCGPVGGTLPEFQYVADVRNLFDFLYPGALPGAVDVPAPFDPAGVLLAVRGAVFPDAADPSAVDPRALRLASIDQSKLPFVPEVPETLFGSVLVPILLHHLALQGVLDDANGFPYDNTATVYAIDGVPQDDVNSGIARLDAPRQSEQWARLWYDPSGALPVPVLTLHTLLDPGVPVWHEALLQAQVQRRGAGARLAQQLVPDYGHCRFTPGQVLGAFDELVRWTETGERPAEGVVPIRGP
jgi:pimeloyl-ACP methyl ester carboxylesterase